VHVIPTDEAARRRHGGPLPGLLAVFATLLRWDQIARERRSLRALDDRALRDLGLTRTDVEREALRPFWDIPSDRRRPWW
jgi:uncharacterized protein YjiS (DUF1127 family)